MRLSSIVLIILVLMTSGCVSDKKKSDNHPSRYFIENKLSFFDPYEITYADHKYRGYTYETWLRKPNNLEMLHETFKKIGYKKLISDYDLTSNPCLLWSYVKRPLNHIIDSLVITYPLDIIEAKYYREFWQRRKKENNDQVVFKILQELAEILLKDKPVEYNNDLVNDTLYNLVYMERVRQNPTEEQARQDFDYLKKIGMHGSAYNLLYENTSYKEIDWDKDKLSKELQTDNKRCCPRVWISDNTK
ncbi:hypothetical protein [Ulvibacterium marinum]|uniref:Lipoprotein n=1 Tax=Ulvibacterium marinum TaxID=2419782 RepID=A0A3B0C2W5_9FLAO|nr:hypothetical protein [Ulvibacterium marinum]RKN79842.1 hypothetical protein D7Z94_16345 [Ulvibacterium marinum]